MFLETATQVLPSPFRRQKKRNEKKFTEICAALQRTTNIHMVDEKQKAVFTKSSTIRINSFLKNFLHLLHPTVWNCLFYSFFVSMRLLLQQIAQDKTFMFTCFECHELLFLAAILCAREKEMDRKSECPLHSWTNELNFFNLFFCRSKKRHRIKYQLKWMLNKSTITVKS